MSGRSINSRLQVLEERLIAERPQPQRPRMEMRARTRPRNQLELSSIPAPPVSQASIETEAKIREIYKMSGLLTIDGKKYRSETTDLQHLGELGNGTCGHVVKMLHKPSGTIIAVKQMRRSGNSEENKRILMDLEVVLRSHGCPYIVRCLGYFITEADVWICMELMASCFDKILKRLSGPIPEDILGNLTVATVKALSYLKVEHDVIHRDVKPSNILIDERGVIKLCDFGISGRLVDSKAKTRGAGCAAYMAPERINPPDPQKPDYDIRADVWSLGITLVELATGRYPYRDCTNDFEVLSKVIEEAPPALPNSPEFSEELRCFVKQCLIKDYRNRPKYIALLEHPFVKRATATSACVGNWLASALPPGSPRLLETPPVIRRIYQLNNAEESNPLLNGLTLTSFSFSTNIERPIQTSNNASEHLSNSVNSINKLAQKNNCEQNDNMTRDNVSLPNMDNLNVCEKSTSSSSTSDKLFSNELNILVNSKDQQDTSTNPFYPIITHEQHTLVNEPIDKSPEKITLESPDSNVIVNSECAAQTQNETPPKDYSPRIKSIDRPFNNPVVYSNNPERWPYKHIATSPNTKNYFANLEIRNQPFSGGGGGGGPSSFDNYTNPNRRQELMHSQMRPYGSPEVNRKQYFSPSRNRVSSTAYEHGYQDPEPPPAFGSPTNLVLLKNDGCEVITADIEPSPPCFRPNGPTNYFTATSVCTMSRYPGAPIVRNRSNLMYGGSYHQNPGGSCSQPASLEAYGDTRQTSHGYSRTPEKSFSPPLWSPQPAHRWAVREQEERERDSWRNESNHHQQGNTSPIVLQRFYHQQGQRRSRRDWDSSSRQSSSSLSRDTSVGRSPEPPRRTNRDPSLPRDQSSCKESPSSLVDNADLISYYKFYNNKSSAQATEHPLLREWRERERTPSKYKSQCDLDGDRQPDLIKPYRADSDRERCFSPPDPRLEREKIVNEANAQFESKIKKSTYHHHMREEQNGDCYKVNPDVESHSRSELARKNSREKSRSTNEKEKKNERISSDSKEENSYNLHILHSKHGKAHGKDRDEQGWLNSIAGIMKRRFTSYVKLHLGANNHTGSSRSSSPSGVGGSGKASRLTPLPRRVATSDCDDINKRMQDCSHNFVRVSGVPPQPPPRRTTDSWSLPASPLPTRPF